MVPPEVSLIAMGGYVCRWLRTSSESAAPFEDSFQQPRLVDLSMLAVPGGFLPLSAVHRLPSPRHQWSKVLLMAEYSPLRMKVKEVPLSTIVRQRDVVCFPATEIAASM